MVKKPCCWKVGVKRGAWSSQEDEALVNYITNNGIDNWRSLPQKAGLSRCGKSCRLRWLNYLRPGIRRGNISSEEEDLIIKLHALLGNRWALIAGRLPGRTDNEIKNYWNTTLARKLGRRGQPSRRRLSTIKRRRTNKSTMDNKEISTQAIRTKAFRCTKTVFISTGTNNKDNNNNNNNNNNNVENRSFFTTSSDGRSSISSAPILLGEGDDYFDFDIDEALLGPDSMMVSSGFLEVNNNGDGDDEKQKEESPIVPLEVELKKVASFLDLEDEWEDLCIIQETKCI